MSLEEREQVLDAFHPDYIKEKMRDIRVGISKGQRMPLELADIVEGRPRISPDFDLSEPFAETDVLVIGGGGAGASAALLAQENGAKVIVATKLRFGDANTMMAQGGIQAADRPNDSPAIHYLDVIGGGHFTNVPELVGALVMDAPFVIKWLEDLGMMFDKKPDGRMLERHGGGTSRMRMHSARDYSGAEIMRTLRDEVRNREEENGEKVGITVIEFSPAVELVLDDKGQATGAVLMNLETGRYCYIKSKAVVMATGGGGRLHYQGFPTTNHYGATADGVVMAYRAGTPLGYLESMQYHPTGAAFPEQIVGLLVTEKVRGLGAQPVNKFGEQFVYPLEPRDVEAASFIRECAPLPSPPELGGTEGGRGGRSNGIVTPTGQPGLWLDSPMKQRHCHSHRAARPVAGFADD
jgi:succinate dehydrogenase/fumarate reductase flavoprotein subunit